MPTIPEAFALAVEHFNAGRLQASENICRQILAVVSDHPNSLNLLGILYARSGAHDRAAEYFRLALAAQPDWAEAHTNLGNILWKLGKLADAESALQRALQLQPANAEAHNSLGAVLRAQGKLDDAADHYRQAVRLKPTYAEAHYNLGIVLKTQGKLDEAAACYRLALQLKPDYADAHYNMGNIAYEQRHIAEALACYHRVLHLKPDHADAHFALGRALLLQGDFERGWAECEWRLDTKLFSHRRYRQPRWDGAPLRERTILIYAEQGLGDTLQFIRYVELLQQSGSDIAVECQSQLLRLLKQSFRSVQFLENNEPPPPFDVHCPLLSLPLAMRTTLANIPCRVPYLQADADAYAEWRQKVARDRRSLKVGLVWAGNKDHQNDRNRSMTLRDLAPLGKVANVRFYSLQKGEPAQQTPHLSEELPLIDWTNDLHDFADTAALVANLDLVISVCTSVAHLAGALGKPVWTLLPYAGEWRWLLDGDDSPWYPTMRLFRQRNEGDWTRVVQSVGDALVRFAGESERV